MEYIAHIDETEKKENTNCKRTFRRNCEASVENLQKNLENKSGDIVAGIFMI